MNFPSIPASGPLSVSDVPMYSDNHLRAAVREALASERKRAAAEILAQKVTCTEPYHDEFPKPSCWTCGRNGAFHRAARIAAGLPAVTSQPVPEPAEEAPDDRQQ